MFIRKAFLSQVGEGFYTCEITYKFVKLNNLCSFGKYLRAGIHKFVGDFTRVKSHTKLVKPLVGDFTRVKSSPNRTFTRVQIAYKLVKLKILYSFLEQVFISLWAILHV